MRSILLSLAASSAVVLGATTATAIPASAAAPSATATAPSNCPSGATCGYTGENYTGSEGIIFGNNANLGGIWQEIESVFNNGNNCNIVLYHDTNDNPAGGAYTLNRGHGLTDIASVQEGLWHHVSSDEWVGCAS